MNIGGLFVLCLLLEFVKSQDLFESECDRSKNIPKDRSCKKKCSKNKQCKENSVCICDDVCGMSCVNKDSKCKDPPDIDNGNVRVSEEEMKYGSKAIYSCNDGYTLKGAAERVCRSDKKWSGKKPECRKVSDCSPPEEIKNGKVKYDSLKLDSKAQYKCNAGYKIIGASSRKCKADGTWSKSLPRCEKSACTFPDRRDEAFPSVDPGKTTFVQGDVVTYKCRFGFTLSGSPNITCQDDNSWTRPEFVCVKVNCGRPDKPRNGYFEGEEFVFGSWVTYKCDVGYRMKNSKISRRYCSTTGSWSGVVPQCEIKSCPPPALLRNGEVKPRGYTYGSIAKYSCDAGYKISGNKEGSCSDDGSWGEVPTCEVDINCDFEDAARPLCGYTNERSEMWTREYVEINRGGFPTSAMKFSGSESSAILKSPVIPDGKPHCLQFYFLPQKPLASVTDLSIDLNRKKISGAAPEGVFMPEDRWIGFQTTLNTDIKSFLFEIVAKGSVPIFIDDISVLKGECKSNCPEQNPCMNGGICVSEIESFYCSCTGMYQGERCETLVTCDKPRLENGNVVAPERLVLGSKLTFQCDNGFAISGSSHATCMRNGISAETPTCQKIVDYQGECPSGFSPHQLMCYRIFKQFETYDSAKSICEQYNSQLATVQSRQVDDFILKLSPGSPDEYSLWIGLRSRDYTRKWESGFEYKGMPGVETDFVNAGPNFCGAYHYRFSGRAWWRKLSRSMKATSCQSRSLFVCESWKKSASSVSVSTWNGRLNGVYRPMNGLVYEASERQVYYKKGGSWNIPMFLYHKDSGREGWYIGEFDVRHSKPGYWYAFNPSHSTNPHRADRAWQNRDGGQFSVRITENNWWRPWTSWEQCSVSCGQGMRSKTRLCTDGLPGSMECKGKDREFEKCIGPSCQVSANSIIYGGILYKIFTRRVSRNSARQTCANENMMLAKMTDQERRKAIADKAKSMRADNNPDLGHVWLNGIRKAYTNDVEFTDGTMTTVYGLRGLWASGEPRGWWHFSYCIEMTWSGFLNDQNCDHDRAFVCEKAVPQNPCDVGPCQSNRECIQIQGGYDCVCPSGTMEPQCEQPDNILPPINPESDVCDKDPCFGGGKCVANSDLPEGFVCYCRLGREGKHCETDSDDKTSTADENVSRPSPTQVQLTTTINSCRNGFCDTSTTRPRLNTTPKGSAEDPCIGNPCNGGKCNADSAKIEGFVCFCSLDRKGTFCEIEHVCNMNELPSMVKLYRSDTNEELDGKQSIKNGDSFRITCNNPDEIVLGEQTIVCGNRQWSRSTKMTCVQRDGLCTREAQDTNVFKVYLDDGSQVKYFPMNVPSGRSLQFDCDLDGETKSTTVMCVSGKWQSSIPDKCVIVSCSDIVIPDRGSITVLPKGSLSPYEPGVRISFFCERLYQVSGPTTITCKDDGSWSGGTPKCEEIGCLLFPDLDLNKGVSVKGDDSGNDINVKKGKKVTLKCKKKEIIVRCMGKDSWEPALSSVKC